MSTSGSIYSHYCAAYVIAAAGSDFECDVTGSDEHAAAVMLGAAEGLTAKHTGMFAQNTRMTREAVGDAVARLLANSK